MRNRLIGLAALLVLSCVLFMTLGVRASWDFVLPFRGVKLAALIVVAVAISTATVLFQTITQNRILTPSIMGFDALYVLILTAAVFFLGAQSFIRLPDQLVFLITAAILIVASIALFGTLLRQARADLLQMILTGIIFGVLFRSLTSFMQRLIDPNEYAVIQVNSYARFTRVETDLLAITAVVTTLAIAIIWRLRHRYDVLVLGYDTAVNLGENPRQLQLVALFLISILVSVSTALVGPVAFLGLLVVSVARLVTPAERHSVVILSSGLISAIVLVGGQTIMERVLKYTTPLSVVVDVVGGLVFLFLLLRGMKKR